MPAAVIPIGPPGASGASGRGSSGDGSLGKSPSARTGQWWLLEIAPSVGGGAAVIPWGILLVDDASDQLTLRCREADELAELTALEEQELDLLGCLADDLRQKAGEQGGAALLGALEDTLSNFLRLGERAAIAYAGSAGAATERLYGRFVDTSVKPFVTHLPYYGLRAAATRFGESRAAGESAGEDAAWLPVRTGRTGKKLHGDMFVARVVGRSMEPLIPDDSLCVFRAGVAGSRQGKYLLIEQFGETDFATRYTVKRYTSRKRMPRAEARGAAEPGDESFPEEGSWEHEQIRLEPRNGEFPAFDLGPDEFRVIAEFVEVLGPAADYL